MVHGSTRTHTACVEVVSVVWNLHVDGFEYVLAALLWSLREAIVFAFVLLVYEVMDFIVIHIDVAGSTPVLKLLWVLVGSA